MQVKFLSKLNSIIKIMALEPIGGLFGVGALGQPFPLTAAPAALVALKTGNTDVPAETVALDNVYDLANDNAGNGVGEARKARVNAFNTRYGFDLIKKINQDAEETIRNPADRLQKLNKEYDTIANKLSYDYAVMWNQMAKIYGAERATQLADMYILPRIQQEKVLLSYKYPYSFNMQNTLRDMIEFRSDKVLREEEEEEEAARAARQAALDIENIKDYSSKQYQWNAIRRFLRGNKPKRKKGPKMKAITQ